LWRSLRTPTESTRTLPATNEGYGWFG